MSVIFIKTNKYTHTNTNRRRSVTRSWLNKKNNGKAGQHEASKRKRVKHGKLDMALKTDHESTYHAERGDRIMYEKEGRGKNNITTE